MKASYVKYHRKGHSQALRARQTAQQWQKRYGRHFERGKTGGHGGGGRADRMRRLRKQRRRAWIDRRLKAALDRVYSAEWLRDVLFEDREPLWLQAFGK